MQGSEIERVNHFTALDSVNVALLQLIDRVVVYKKAIEHAMADDLHISNGAPRSYNNIFVMEEQAAWGMGCVNGE